MTQGHLDSRFSDPSASGPSYDDIQQLLAAAELYWLTTVRPDGRPHVSPVVGVWHEGGFCFCTGEDEQKFKNLTHSPLVAVTTGANTWTAGTDVVAEGSAVRVTGPELEKLAAAWFDKYGEDWRWDTDGDGFVSGDNHPRVFRVTPTKVIAFAKHPHGQTTYRP